MTNGDFVNVVNISGLRGARMSGMLIRTRDQLRNNRVSIVCLAVALGTTALCPIASAQTSPSTTPATPPADTSPAAAPPPASQSTTALPPVDVRPARQKRAARPKARPAQAKRAAPIQAPPPAEPQSLPETADRSPSGFAATRSSVGTKTDTPIMETPQSVSVVTQDQLQARAVQSITEALRYVPGVYTSQGGAEPRFDLFTIRGFNTTGDGTYRDGLRDLGNPNNFTLFRNNPYGVERIDVLRGPSSVLYGAGGPGGLINIISKKPTEQPFGEVYGLLGSEKRREAGFDVGGALDKDGHYLARLTGMIREGQAQVPYFSNFIPDDRYFIAPAFTWRPSEDTKLTILADVGHERTGNNFAMTIAKLSGGIVGVRPTTLFLGDPSFNKFDQDQFRVGYQFEHRLNDAVTVRQNLRYGEVDVDYRYLTGFAPEGSTTATRFSRLVDERTSSFTADNHAQAKFATGPVSHTMLVGLDVQRFGLDARFNGGAAPPLDLINPQYYVPVATPTAPITSTDQTAKQLGAYIQDQIKFNNWVVTAGTRYDWADLDSTDRIKSERTVRNDQAQSNKIGVVYLFDFGLAPYASYSESFLPNTGTDFFGGTFKPTTGQQYEAGARYTIPGSRVMVTFAAFDITQQNVLQPDPDLAHNGFSVQTGEIRSRGYEAELVANLAEGLNAVASYTRQDLEVTMSSGVDLGKRPILTPSNLASAYLDYTIPTGRLTGLGFGGGVRYVGSTYMDNRNTALNDPYTLYDVGVHYKMANGVTAALNVTNLFDKEYATCSFVGGCNWNAGRVVTGTMKYRW
jgi:iron complex outermembrane recepter protein